jgi:hypothetical protein
MKFVKTENLKIGMRLARPIYSKSGVLLFDRNSNLSSQAIDSVKNFGLLGVYVLEPAEPLPPMSDEDREFERFQTMAVFSIQEELSKILATKKQNKMQSISDMIIRTYGRQNGKVNFYQNLRSRDDYVYRHSLNVAILCAMMTHMMNVRLEEQQQIIYAAVVHDIGKLSLAGELAYSNELTDEQRMQVYSAQLGSGELIEGAFGDGVAIRRICNQALTVQMEASKAGRAPSSIKMVRGAKILLVANRYDELTGMTLEGTAESEVKAIREFYDNPEVYDPEIVAALVNSINILFPGVSVELNTGEKALVLTENANDILRPVVLSFRDNTILDLSLKVNADIEVVDIMKTLDNRCIMDTATLHQAGF